MRLFAVLLLFFVITANGQWIFWGKGKEAPKRRQAVPIPEDKLFFKADSQISCILTQSVEKIIDGDCNHLIGNEHKKQKLIVSKNVNNTKWQKFTNRLKSINHVDIEIKGTSITQIYLNINGKIHTEAFTITNNPNLEEINITGSGWISVANFRISGNPKLKYITFTGKKYDGGLIIQNNGQLEQLHLHVPEIETPLNGPGFKIDNNPKLEMITTNPEKFSFKIHNNFIFTRNHGIASLPLYSAGILDVSAMTITENDQLEQILFHPAAEEHKIGTMNIEINSRLHHIQANWKKWKQTKMKIHGNPILEAKILTKLADVATGGGDIQRFGECVFPQPVTNLTRLRLCKYVTGDLNLTANPSGSTAGHRISEIRGNVNLGSLSHDCADFLSGTKFPVGKEIRSDLCDFPKILYGHFVKRPPCSTTTILTTTTTILTTTTEAAVGGPEPQVTPNPHHIGIPRATESPLAASTQTGGSSSTPIIIIGCIIFGVLIVGGMLSWFFVIRKKRAKDSTATSTSESGTSTSRTPSTRAASTVSTPRGSSRASQVSSRAPEFKTQREKAQTEREKPPKMAKNAKEKAKTPKEEKKTKTISKTNKK